MGRALLVGIAMALAALAGWSVGRREVGALRARVAELAKRPEHCAPPSLLELGSAIAAMKSAPPPAPAASPPPSRDDAAAGGSGHPPGDLFADGVEDDRMQAAASLQSLALRLALTSDQEGALHATVAQLDASVAKAANALVALPDAPTSHQWVGPLIDGLSALRRADETFRASLTPEQRTLLDAEDFDIAEQIDPAIMANVLSGRPTQLDDATAPDGGQ